MCWGHCTMSAIPSLHTRKVSITHILETASLPNLRTSWPFQLLFLHHSKLNNTQFVLTDVYSVHSVTRLVYHTHHRKVVSSVDSAYAKKFHIPQEKATSYCVCTGVCSDHPDISDTYYKHCWKTNNTLHTEMEAPHYVMYKGESNENLVSAKKSWPYCVQPYAYEIISIG